MAAVDRAAAKTATTGSDCERATRARRALCRGHRPRPRRADRYVVLAFYKLGIILEGTHARASPGKVPKETGDRLHAHTPNLFHRALRRIG